MAKMTKVLKRQLSAEERIQRYFKQVEKELLESFRIGRVELDRNGHIEVLQIITVVTDGHGVRILCR